MPVTFPRTLCASATLLALASSAGPARADDKEACVAASDQAQTQRDEGKFRAARASLLSCSRDACPSIVRRDCEKWLVELDSAQPTLVLGARDPNGNDVSSARVRLDGAVLIERIDGKPVAVDPGEHVFRYESPGSTPVEQRVVVRVGEKNRMLTAILMPVQAASSSTAASSPSPSPASVAPPPDAESPSSRGGTISPAAWVFTAVSVAAVGSFVFFGLTAQSDVQHLRETCSPNCAQSDVDSARTKLLVADVSLGAAAVSAGVALWFFLHRTGGSSAGASLPLASHAGIAPRPGGAVGTFSVSF